MSTDGRRVMLQRVREFAPWMAAPLLGLALYWPGLMSWFQKDDFAWLGLRDLIHSRRDLLWALFAPMAEGTIRPISERIFYLSFTSLFGLHPLPYHVWIFLTYAATTVVLSAVCARLTGSLAAGFWAATLWTVNGVLAVPLSWSPIYYEILCSLFLLVSLWLLIRYQETNRPVFYWLQCATFVAGFGVLELNVVYPALAVTYAVCRAPRLLSKLIPLFVLSAGYMLWHLHMAPLSASGVYKLHWDFSVFSTLRTYWFWALGPNRLSLIGVFPSRWRSLWTVLLMGGLIVFLGVKLRRRQWTCAFFPAWFLIVLSPLLPLRDHLSDYYLTIPLIGLAMWGGWALVEGWEAGGARRLAAAVLLIIYLGVSIPVGRATTLSFYHRSQAIRAMLQSIVQQSRKTPGKLVLLKGVDPDMFWSCLYHRPLRLYGIQDVYMIGVDNSWMDESAAGKAVREGRAVVYDLRSGEAADVTGRYK